MTPRFWKTRPRRSLVRRIWRIGRLHDAESNGVIRERAIELAFRAQSGEPLDRFIAEGCSLVATALQRVLGIRPYDEQIVGGLQLVRRGVIQMETGQGKTLTAAFPLFLYGLYGAGAHLATTNDYLAERDAELLRPVFELLGLTTGAITSRMDDAQRAEHYRRDITYGAATEFGFDFLRDRIGQRESVETGIPIELVMRDLAFAVVDEADAVLIDEANMPMIIGAAGAVNERKRVLYRWAAELAADAEESLHFRYDLRTRQVELTRSGRAWARTAGDRSGLEQTSLLDQQEKLECAIRVHRDFHRDQQYILRDGEIVLVNEATGRAAEGRQWQDGVHQAIQAKERLEITAPPTHAAKITIQGFFLSYRRLVGMTGTATAATAEFRKVYRMKVVRIPTHQRSRRRELPTRYFRTATEKWQAVCQEIRQLQADGRPVLVGTRSVERSEALSRRLHEFGIAHTVLNARENEREAAIIAQAGAEGCVTVATGMAGRGTDIKLSDGARASGGLHVILTELHDSPRMDWQLVGRCARQGDPGTFRRYLSLDDDILDLGLGTSAASRIRQRRTAGRHVLELAQARLERRRRGNRLTALYREKRKMRSIWEMGRDPLLDAV